VVILDCKERAIYAVTIVGRDETKENVQRAVLPRGYCNADAVGRMNKGKNAGVSIAGLWYNVNTPSNISVG
jgi:hypothetical protein